MLCGAYHVRPRHREILSFLSCQEQYWSIYKLWLQIEHKQLVLHSIFTLMHLAMLDISLNQQYSKHTWSTSLLSLTGSSRWGAGHQVATIFRSQVTHLLVVRIKLLACFPSVSASLITWDWRRNGYLKSFCIRRSIFGVLETSQWEFLLTIRFTLSVIRPFTPLLMVKFTWQEH